MLHLRTFRLAALATFVAAVLMAPAAQAVPAGTGIRGSMAITWGNISGAPIASWNGSLQLQFDPSADARRATIAASTDPALGEPWRPLFGPQVQAVRVMQLSSDKVEAVTCQNDALEEYTATWSSSVASMNDGRISFEVMTPSVDLLAGTGSVHLEPYVMSNSSAGDTGWWVNDRIAVPGRWTSAGSYPCPGSGSSDPAPRQQRIIAVNGHAAAPVAVYDWLESQPVDEYRLRRTTAGWRLQADASRRVTFSESRFGPQDTQELDLQVRSQLYLAGSLLRLGARCRVPKLQIERAASASAAVLLAKRAGLIRTVFAGTRSGSGTRPRYVIEGRLLDSQGHAPCMAGSYRIVKYVPPRR